MKTVSFCAALATMMIVAPLFTGCSTKKNTSPPHSSVVQPDSNREVTEKNIGEIFLFPSKYSKYEKHLVDGIRTSWYRFVTQLKPQNEKGTVVFKFKLHSDGKVTDLNVEENKEASVDAVFACENAILRAAPFQPWPPDMKKELGEFRILKFTFYILPPETQAKEKQDSSLASYDRYMNGLIQHSWEEVMLSTGKTNETGMVVLQFALWFNGSVTHITVVKADASQEVIEGCKKAILQVMPFKPWPVKIRHELGDFRMIKLTLSAYSADPKRNASMFYDHYVVDSVKRSWNYLIAQKRFQSQTGKVILVFTVHSDGKITDLTALNYNANAEMLLNCQTAVLRLAPLNPWPSEMKSAWGESKEYQITINTLPPDSPLPPDLKD